MRIWSEQRGDCLARAMARSCQPIVGRLSVFDFFDRKVHARDRWLIFRQRSTTQPQLNDVWSEGKVAAPSPLLLWYERLLFHYDLNKPATA
jgi:hypothetical protein